MIKAYAGPSGRRGGGNSIRGNSNTMRGRYQNNRAAGQGRTRAFVNAVRGRG